MPFQVLLHSAWMRTPFVRTPIRGPSRPTTKSARTEQARRSTRPRPQSTSSATAFEVDRSFDSGSTDMGFSTSLRKRATAGCPKS